jgi:hypothetical protein
MLCNCLDESLFALLGAEHTLLVTQQQHFPLVAEEAAHLFAGKLAAVMIVAGDEADRIARLECGVDHHGGDTGSRGFLDGTYERVLVERRQHDPIHSLREKPLHNLHLLLTVILAKRPFPDDLDVDVLRAKVARRFDCSGMNALPELVRRPLRDHSCLYLSSVS